MLFKKRPQTEQDLVSGCTQNDRYCQEQLYRRFFPAMLHMCLRYTSDQETAMEIVNNGFLRVFQKIGLFQFQGSLEGWIRRIVFHAVSDYFRAQNKSLHFLILEEHDRPVDPQPLSQLYAEEILDMVEQLPEATKNVFLLYAVEGMSHPEIARQEKISVGTSKWHLSHARSILKQLLDQYNQSSYAG